MDAEKKITLILNPAEVDITLETAGRETQFFFETTPAEFVLLLNEKERDWLLDELCDGEGQ